MDEQLEQTSRRLRRTVHLVCENIISAADEEIQTLQERHASKLQDYEDLQHQHRLTLESCELLRAQNLRLQGQLKDLLAKGSTSRTSGHAESAIRSESARKQSSLRQISLETQSLIEANPELQAILDEQAGNYKKLQAAHGLLLEKLKEHQEVIVQLQLEKTNSTQLPASNEERLARLRRIIGGAKDSPAQQRGSPGRAVSSPVPDITKSSNPPLDEQSRDADGRTLSTETHQIIDLDTMAPEHVEDVATEQEILNLPCITTTSPRQNDAHPAITTPANFTTIDSSQPEFVSERPAKRRRTMHANTAHGRTIKSEATLMEPANFGEGHSIDLDIVSMPIILPETRPTSDKSLRSVEPTKASVTNGTGIERHSEPPMMTNSISLDTNHRSASEIVTENEQQIHGMDGSSDDFTLPPQPSSGDSYFIRRPQRTALQPKPANAQIAATADRSERSTESNLKGGDPKSIRKKNAAKMPSSGLNTALTHNGPGPDEQSSEPSLERSNKASSNAIGKYQTPLQRKRDRPEKQLRNKATNELSLNDFVLNRAMNQGFNQALGTGDARKAGKNCPPDCSRPECCGIAFATAVQSAGISSLQDLTGEEKDRLIQAYLGFPVSGLGALSSQGYQKLLGEAIGKQFAEQYGKHKQIRADSPPGYWRADFPTTQERETDKELAEEIEKAAIEERREEALRSGGLWVFRDE